jgi:hypothetical protein
MFHVKHPCRSAAVFGVSGEVGLEVRLANARSHPYR